MAAPIVGEAICLILMSRQFEKEILRIIAMSVTIRAGFSHEKLFVAAVRIPELEGDRVHRAVRAIAGVSE